MNISKRIASIAVVAALSVAGLAAVTMVGGHDGRWGQSALASPDRGKHGDKSMCRRGGKHGEHGRHGRHGGPDLAEKLSVMETKIGIRANQLDAWRDFTDALQATMKRPMRPGGPGMMAPGANAAPFSLAEGFADRAIDRGKSAEDLKKAIAELRTTLTSEQLEKVKQIEAKLRAKMAYHHGWSRHGKGPHRMGPHGKGPHGPPPHAGPGQDGGSSDTDDDDDDDDS